MDLALLKAAFETSAAAVSELHGVDVEHVAAPSRGRGYKPPIETVGARKLAIYLTVMATGCQYAELARAIGLHKDTVCSHCEDVRRLSMDDDLEALTEAMRARLVDGVSSRTRRWRAQQIMLRAPAIHPTSSDAASDEQKNIVILEKKRRVS